MAGALCRNGCCMVPEWMVDAMYRNGWCIVWEWLVYGAGVYGCCTVPEWLVTECMVSVRREYYDWEKTVTRDT